MEQHRILPRPIESFRSGAFFTVPAAPKAWRVDFDDYGLVYWRAKGHWTAKVEWVESEGQWAGSVQWFNLYEPCPFDLGKDGCVPCGSFCDVTHACDRVWAKALELQDDVEALSGGQES